MQRSPNCVWPVILIREKWKVKVTQSCPTLCDPMDCSPVGSSVHGILQARVLEWVAVPFSRESSRPRDQTHVSLIAGGFFTVWATREAHRLERRWLNVKCFPLTVKPGGPGSSLFSPVPGRSHSPFWNCPSCFSSLLGVPAASFPIVYPPLSISLPIHLGLASSLCTDLTSENSSLVMIPPPMSTLLSQAPSYWWPCWRSVFFTWCLFYVQIFYCCFTITFVFKCMKSSLWPYHPNVPDLV